MSKSRPSQLAELFCREFDPELFSHSAYVKFLLTFATKVPYLIFCDKMRQFFIQERDKEGGNKKKMRKFPHALSISSSFSHSLSIFSQPGCQGATICATLSKSTRGRRRQRKMGKKRILMRRQSAPSQFLTMQTTSICRFVDKGRHKKKSTFFRKKS